MLLLVWALLMQPSVARTEEKAMVLYASAPLIDSGLLGFVLPRFSLKTGVAVTLKKLEREGEMPPRADAVLARQPPPGLAARAAFEGKNGLYQIALRRGGKSAGAEAAERFASWLLSQTGMRTVAQFRRNGIQLFHAPKQEAEDEQTGFAGNTARGEELAYANCGRCHVVGQRNRMQGIESTPSLAALRALGDWRERFQTFYARNPHPAVLQIIGISAPFAQTAPSPMVPVKITQAEFEDILAFVGALAPADLGAEILHQ